MERIGVITAREIRVTLATHIHRTYKLFLLHTPVQRHLGLGSIIERQIMESRRRRQGLQRTCRRELFGTANIPQFNARLYRANRKPIAGTRHHGIHIDLKGIQPEICESDSRKETDKD